MRTDTKIGLALAILVIGFAAAFCFRLEVPEVTAGKLERSEELDSQIERLPIRSYTRLDAQPKEEPVRIEETKPPERLSVPEQEVKAPEGIARLSEPLPMPEPGGARPIPREHEEQPSRVEGQGDRELPDSERDDYQDDEDGTVHVVRAGETLSGIASRYLGSAGRFEEILTANRDVIRDADRLMVGIELRIPQRETGLVASRPPVRSSSRQTPNPVEERGQSQMVDSRADESGASRGQGAREQKSEESEQGAKKFNAPRRRQRLASGGVPKRTASAEHGKQAR